MSCGGRPRAQLLGDLFGVDSVLAPVVHDEPDAVQLGDVLGVLAVFVRRPVGGHSRLPGAMGGSSAPQMEQRIGPRYSSCSIAGCRQVRQSRVPLGGATGTLVSGLGDWAGNSSNQKGIFPHGTLACSANGAQGSPSSTSS